MERSGPVSGCKLTGGQIARTGLENKSSKVGSGAGKAEKPGGRRVDTGDNGLVIGLKVVCQEPA